MPQKRKRYSGEFKARIALEAIKGQRPLEEIAHAAGVEISLVVQWRDQLIKGASSVLTNKRNKQLNAQPDIDALASFPEPEQSVLPPTVIESVQYTANSFNELSNELQRIQKNIHYILTRVTLFFDRSFERAIDLNQRFHELVWKYVFRGAGVLEDSETLSVDRQQSIDLWRDCILEAATWSAVSYGDELWQYDEQEKSKAYQDIHVKLNGRLSRVFVFDTEAEALKFQSNETNQDILLVGDVRWIIKSELLEKVKDRLGIDLESIDFLDFAVANNDSYVLWFKLLGSTQKLERAILTINGEIINRAQQVFDMAFKSGKTFPQSLVQPQQIIILFLSADPTDATHLRLGEELREIKEKLLQMSALRNEFQLESRESLRPADISQALLDVKPQIVHFSGHGMKEGAICFENTQGKIHPVEAETLAELFKQFTSHISCVILNACYSQIQADAIAQYVDYVIGMTKDIEDRAAIAFSIGFYQALGAGRTIEEAHDLGCVQIKLQGIPEHLIPVLIKKKKV